MYERLLRRSGSVSKPATIAGPSGGRRTLIRPSPTRQRAAGAPSASGNAAAPETARRARIGERFVRAFAAVSLLLLGTLAIALPAQSQTVPSAPLKFTATALATQVDLEWSAPEDDGGSTLVRYEARRAKGASVPDDTEWNELQLNRAFSYSGLESGELYTFELRAVNAHGAGAVARIQATPTSRPTAPEDFSAEPGDAQAVLSWSAPANNRGSGIVRYEVRHVAGASVPMETAWTSVGLVTTHTVTGLANGTQHTFEVRAVNGCCAGDVAQLQATPGGPPTAPQDFTFRNYPGYAALSWSAPADDKGFEILRYEFRAIEGPDFAENSPWISIGLITSGRYDTLSDGTLYTFEVRAVNERGPGAAARLQVTPDKPSVSVEAIQSTVTEGSDVQFRFRRDRDEHLALRLFVDIAGHLKTMSPTTRNLSFSSDTGRDLAVTFEPGQSETTVSLTTEADRVNEGDGEIVVTIQQSPNFYIAGRGKAAVLVEDDDIPEVTLRWVSPAMTLQNNVWVGSMVEGEEIRYEVVCSGNTLIPADLDGRTGADAITQQRIVVRKQENLNHPIFPQYNNDQEFRAPCADSPSMYRLHFGSIRNRFTGPENGEIRIDLLPQLLATSSLYHCYQDSVRHSAQAEDVRFCPKYTLGAVTTARIEVLNRNPTVTVEAVDDEVTEGDPARFRLTRIWTSDWLSPGTLLAASTTIDYTSTAVGSYVPSPPSGQKIFAPTETEVIVEIPTERDGVTGEDGLVTFELLPGTLSTQQSNVGGHYEIYDQLAGVTPPGKSSRVATVRVLNDETGRGVAVSVLALRVPEGESRTYTVALETQPTGPVTVTPSVAGSADVTVSPAALTFTAETWNRAQTVTVSAAQDDDAANDAATVSHAVSGSDYGSVTVDEDAGATTVTVTGTLDGAPRTSETAVTVSVSAGTASAADFAAVADVTLTIPAGQTSGTATFTLTPVDDAIDEDDETVVVAGTAQALAVTGAAVTVEDDDTRGIEVSASSLTIPEGESRTYTVVLRSQPTGPVTVTASVTGSPDVTVSGALTFTAATWNRAQTVTVSAAQDADAANDAATVSHAVSGGGFDSVTAADVAVTVSDDETASAGVALTVSPGTVNEDAGATTVTVTGTLDGAPRTSETAVTVSVSAGTASAADFAAVADVTLTIPAGQSSGTATFTLTPVDDAIYEGDETVNVTGMAQSLAVTGAAVEIVDDETASGGVALTVSPGTVDEDAGATTVTVTGTLDGAPRTSETAVTVSVSAGTASAADFAAVADFTLTIPAGQTSGTATFTLTPVDDAIDEDDETVNVTGMAQSLAVTGAVVEIVDDDGRGVRISPTDLTIPEGESRTYTVVLETQPTGPVTVTPSVTGSPDVTVSGALTFTAETWNRAQTVTVSAAQDDDAANDAATVSHAVSGGGYGSATAADVAVTVEDDDEHGVRISPTDLTIPEGESRTYTVVLETQPTGPVTVTPSAAGDPDVSVISAALTFTAETWNRAQTVTVSAAHDSDAENDAATVSHAVSGGGYGSATVPDVAVTVEDDDSASTAVALTVSPGTVEEDAGATTVTVTGTLNEATRTSDTAVTVSVSAGTASAADFAAVADFTLTIAAGQTSGTATFTLTPVDDSINEPDETIVVGGTSPGLEVTAATVSIVNADSFPQAWIARFARTVAEQVLEAVDSRMTARSAPGLEVQVAGQRVGNAGPPADGAVQWTGSGRAAGQAFGRNFGGWPGRQDDPALRSGDASRSTMERNLLTGSSFSLTKATDGGGLVSLWGRGALTRFDGREDDVSLDGEVTSGILGADWTWGDATAGMILSHNRGTGSYRGASDSGLVSSFLNGFFPWGRYALNERLTVWGVAGYGVGALTVSPDGEAPVRTDLDLAMFAAGLRGALAQASETAGMDLAWKADGFYVRARSAGTHRLPSARAEVTRLRLALEGSRPFRLEGGATLTPSFEIGGRLDGGDAETGLGVDIGGGIAWVHPASGISADLKGRALLTHESLGFSNLGISGSFAWDPDPASNRGPSLTLRQTMGASATGGVDALLGRETLAGLAANDNGNGQQNRRLEIRMGYGFPAFGDRFTSTPELGFAFGESRREYSLGWRLGHGRNGLAPLEFNLEARRSEPVDPGSDPDHSVRFGLTARW